ncbi:PucR family transcriptional regulator [Humibacter sp. BT305]|nr:PucR family transcriptional regulator [Humibacter sp. BT305]
MRCGALMLGERMHGEHCQNGQHGDAGFDVVAHTCGARMPVTLGDLVTAPEFGLRMVWPTLDGGPGPRSKGGPEGGPEGASDSSEQTALPRVLATEVAWVHSSDLPDPAPWLEPGQLLLSDGAQFAGDRSERFAQEYVARLADRGLIGLGLSEGIVHDRIPDAVVEACRERGLPLVSVPRRTPFIAVIRYVADILARDRRERLEWSLDAQRAVARAASSTGGLGATIDELERRLGGWAALYDAAGRPLPFGGAPAEHADQVELLVQRTLTTPRPNRRHSLGSDEAVALERIGTSAHPLGVLAVRTTAPFDPAANDLVASVLALASIALEQRRALDLERRRLRSGALELLLSGRLDTADRVAAPLWGTAPDGPLRVAIAPHGAESAELLDALEAAAGDRGWTFFAERDGDLVMIADELGMRTVRSLLSAHAVRAGVSGRVDATTLERGLSEAAAAHTASRAAIGEYDDLVGDGLEGLLVASGAEGLARRMLAPILEADADPARTAEGASLEDTVRAWFESGCSWDRAARVLGVHRHTVRTRVARAGVLLGRDLDDPTDRAEVWLALRLLGRD